jgi:hypothetical protein
MGRSLNPAPGTKNNTNLCYEHLVRIYRKRAREWVSTYSSQIVSNAKPLEKYLYLWPDKCVDTSLSSDNLQ